MTSAKIISVGSYLPKKIVTNDDLSKVVDTSDEWITTRTGIKKRHIAAENESTSDLALNAAFDALRNAGIQKSSIDAVIVATTTPDYIFPSTAAVLQNKLGINAGIAFDVQAVCSGFIYAITTASFYIKQKMAKRILVIGAETMSRIVDWNDRSTCVLFGDGAGCVILESSEAKDIGVLESDMQSDCSLLDSLIVKGGVSTGNVLAKIAMNGNEVFRNAVTKLPESIFTLISKTKIAVNDLDWLVLHQANKRIIDAVAKKLEINIKKSICVVDQHANTSAASIPLALDSYIKNNKVKRGDLIVASAIGGGLTWGSTLIRY